MNQLVSLRSSSAPHVRIAQYACCWIDNPEFVRLNPIFVAENFSLSPSLSLRKTLMAILPILYVRENLEFSCHYPRMSSGILEFSLNGMEIQSIQGI